MNWQVKNIILTLLFTVLSINLFSQESTELQMNIDSIVNKEIAGLNSFSEKQLEKFQLNLINIKENEERLFLKKSMETTRFLITAVSFIVGILALTITIITFFNIRNQKNYVERFKDLVEQSSKKEKEFQEKISEVDSLKNEISSFKLLLTEKESLLKERENEIFTRIKLFEDKNRSAFLSLYNDLLDFCMDTMQGEGIKGDLSNYYKEKIFEHQSILMLYFHKNSDELIKSLLRISEKGTETSISHLNYLLDKFEKKELINNNLSDLDKIKKLIYYSIHKIEERK